MNVIAALVLTEKYSEPGGKADRTHDCDSASEFVMICDVGSYVCDWRKGTRSVMLWCILQGGCTHQQSQQRMAVLS